MNPTHSKFNQRVEAHPASDGGVLGGDLIGSAGFVEQTGKLDDQANVVTHGGAAAVRGVTDRTF